MHDESLYDVVSESLISLELPSVLEEVANYALSSPGKQEVLSSQPAEDLETVRFYLDLVIEMREVIGVDGELELGGLIPMELLITRLRNPSVILEAEEILAFSDLLYTSNSIHRRLGALDDRFRLLLEQAERITPLQQLRSRIMKTLDEQGMVRPDASSRLIDIHYRTRSAKERIRKRLEKTVHDQDLARVVQEDYITLRNDRYVILLRPEFKGLLDGIVHDHSRSGASVYVEPLHVVELNNQVASLIDEEREEIRRILQELTEEIRSAGEVISDNYEALVWLDAFQARARYAIATNSVSPVLVDDGFRIRGARHPLLLAAAESEVVPMDVLQPPETSATVISGANMGGKTVALKMAGLFPLMVRCGIMAPAREGTEITPFMRIMADIGDEQDIRGRVSSFSGHMLRMKKILESVSPGDLVLLDELGGATDPDEGSALAMAILDELVQRKARVVVTTHLTHLKAYALSRADVRNVSVEFHPVTLKPTYKLLYDLPGESHAITTAERIGLPQNVVAAARSYLDKSAGGSGQLLESLRRKRSEVEEQRSNLEEKQRVLEEERQEVRAAKEALVETFRKQADEMIRKAEKEITDLQVSMKAGKVKSGREPREHIYNIKQDIEATLGTPLAKEAAPPDVGSRVRVKSLGREGIVKDVLDKRRVDVTLGQVTVRADTEDLVVLDSGRGEKNALKIEQIGVEIPFAAPRWEVNVIGLRVDEALPIVDKALNEAVLGGLPSLSIIHGRGTGRLKKAIREYLATHVLVKGFRSGEAQTGGEAVTVVEPVSE